MQFRGDYRRNRNQLERDLRYLRQQRLVETHHVNARRDGRLGKVERFEVVTVTREGRNLVRDTGELSPGQGVYAGLVKPHEIEHDAQIYRAYLREATRIEENGGTNLRIRLDFELIRTTANVPTSALEYLGIADGELMRIAHITRQTLGFYREFSAATSNSVSALMASVVDLLQAKIRTSGATVEQQCDHQLQVMGVAGELRQLLANLLANSLDAVGENGIVKLRCSVVRSSTTGSHCIRMTVADNGRGIGADAMKQIFDPFFTTKGSIGTGLGLWVCKQLAEKNGGSIRVHSSTDGKLRGATFSVVLPGEAAIPEATA